jgi:DNA repair protein RAD57
MSRSLLNAGISAAGKTQFALQLSLLVQLPTRLGGLSGSACYITTSSRLPTERLVQIAESHPLCSAEREHLDRPPALDRVKTLTADTIPKLLLVLTRQLPALVQQLADNLNSNPVKLLIIDALAELFHSNEKTTTTTLVERSRNISEVSRLLHFLASKHQIAVLVLNEVTDVFERDPIDTNGSSDLIYREQSRWFGCADSIPGENAKEAALGLVWANQVNARIMLSRTNRRQHLDRGGSVGRAGKRRRLGSSSQSTESYRAGVDDQATLIRRLSIVFSSVSRPTSLDYIITMEGFCIVQDQNMPILARVPIEEVEPPPPLPAPVSLTIGVSPLDAGCVHDEIAVSQQAEAGVQPGTASAEDDEEVYWREDADLDAVYNSVDLDFLLASHATEPV